MKKILVVSDSHGNHERIRRVIGLEAPIDMLIHCGDIEGNLSEILGDRTDYRIRAVGGNMDERRFSYLPRQVFSIGEDSFDSEEGGDLRVFLTHGHRYGVNYDLRDLAFAAGEEGCQIAIFGHTHVPLQERVDGVLVLNPGSVCQPRQADRRKSYLVLTIGDGGGLEVDHRYLEAKDLYEG